MKQVAHLVVNGRPVAYARRDDRGVGAHVHGRGFSFHSEGGFSLIGLPRSGGMTVCWGRLRRRLATLDADRTPDCWRMNLGPLAIRVGSDF